MRVLKAAAVELADEPALTGPAAARVEAAEEARRAEVQAAYRQGLEDGRRQAEASGVAAVPMLARAVEHAVAEVGRAAAHQQAVDHDALIEAAIDLARWVLRRELASDPRAALDRVAEALTVLRPGPTVEVRVAPELVAVVAEAAPSSVTVVADPALAAGEAMVDSGAATADLRFDTAFARARAALGTGEDAQEVLDAPGA